VTLLTSPHPALLSYHYKVMVTFNLQSADTYIKWQQCCMILWTNLVNCTIVTLIAAVCVISRYTHIRKDRKFSKKLNNYTSPLVQNKRYLRGHEKHASRVVNPLDGLEEGWWWTHSLCNTRDSHTLHPGLWFYFYSLHEYGDLSIAIDPLFM
jgi:hypothetical protein